VAPFGDEVARTSGHTVSDFYVFEHIAKGVDVRLKTIEARLS